MDEEGLSPILDVRANVDWLTLDIYHFFPRRMKASLRCLYTESPGILLQLLVVVVSLLLPGGLDRIPSLPSPSSEVSDHEAGCTLGKEVAAILRAVLTHETKKLYNDSTVHLLCSNYWIQPIYQELLHSSSRYNATREGERK